MSRLNDVDCVLFDLDGTLVDTAPDLGDATNSVRRDLGLPPLPDADYRPVASAGARGLLKVALNMTPDHQEYPVRRDALLAHYRANLTRRSRLFPGMNQLLVALELAKRPWGVVTNKPAFLTDPLMIELKLDQRAACIISGDQVPKPKPAPDSLLLALERTGISAARTVYVGDDRRDIDAARAAGIRSIAAGWGYLGADAPASWDADHLTATTADLAQLLS
ncbi:MAG: Phosphoglycolate phosphatase [Hydrocarboniphaga sp.]|uniref:HAD family hydrolase n=1 Tax=Hydrocarboniphaga sp. TaxID=2033016 RepID=UPI002634766F|nr:HAD-IA family hydrolase [Hydrocarboniphaga sp.]MDB5969027.1 Phosphoglycolate phosphatase [Hydrocarboniphaga sp.]